MDPKMDSGFLADGESLDDDYNALKPLLPEEVLGIMDQLLCHEMAWHHGYPLAQTLFTSIYIDKLLWPDPKSLDDAQFYRGAKPAPNPLLDVLRAYCVSLVKYCDFVIEKVASRDFYEEEDFSTHTYNRQLLTQTSEDQILAVLDDAARWLALEEESG
jgi:N-alpha-acetyltransferase 35, NatC auxiliary subunit